MATRTLAENTAQAIADFKGIKQAIVENGVVVSDGTPTEKYPEKISEVYHAGKLAVLENSEVLHGTASGEAIAVHDVNPVEHKLGVTVSSKNRVDIKDGIYACSGYIGDGVYVDCEIKANTDYIVSFNYEFLSLDSEYGYDNLALSVNGPPNVNYYPADIMSGTMTLPLIFGSNVDKLYITFISPNYSAEATVRITNFQLELSTEATPYTPYIPDLSAVEVSRYGGNLLPFPYTELKVGTVTTSGITFTTYEDSSILINGTATASVVKYLYRDITSKPDWAKGGTVITISKNADKETEQGKVYFIANYYDANTTMRQGVFATSRATETGTITSDWVGVGFYISVPKGNSIDNLTIKPMIQLGSTATEYEPYKEPQTATANTEGVVEGLTSLSPNMTLVTNTDGVVIDLEYYKDIDLAFENLTTEIALSGGE